jgi:hypothetical protein
MHLADMATLRLGPALSTISPCHLRIAHRRAVIKRTLAPSPPETTTCLHVYALAAGSTMRAHAAERLAPLLLCDQWQAFGITITSAAPPSISAQADSGMYGIPI